MLPRQFIDERLSDLESPEHDEAGDEFAPDVHGDILGHLATRRLSGLLRHRQVVPVAVCNGLEKG